MNKNDIDRMLDDQKKHRQLFGDQFDRINSPANQALRNFQREMDRPNRAARQAMEAMQQDLNRPNNAALEAMKMLQREMDRPNNAVNQAMKALQRDLERPNNAALESIRAFQKQMMLPNERLTELSRSIATMSSHLATNKDLLRGLSSTLAPTFAAIRDATNRVAAPQIDQLSKIAADIGRRQAELLAASWSPAVFASTLRTPEIASMLEGVTSQFAKNNAAVLGSFGQNFFESILRNDTFANLEFLRGTHFADLAVRVGEAVESSGNEEELAANITAIVEEGLEKSDKSRFTTFERISIAFLIIMFILGVYQAVLQTLQYMDSNRPQPAPVIRIDFLRNFQRDFLERYVPFLLKDEIEVEYFIERDVPLMSAPRWNSLRLGKALSGSRALLFERNHKWIFAEVFHPTEDTSQFGWFSKKYSKRII
jgi:ribosomal protein S21